MPERSTDDGRRRRGGLGRIGLGLLAVLGIVAIGAPVLAPYPPDALTGTPLAPPSAAHWLGTDDLGQDILSGVIYGARLSLMFGVVAGVLATGLAAIVGLWAGYARGAVDIGLMRLVDTVLALPVLPLTIVLGAFLGAGLSTELMVVCVVMWARPARELRAQVLSVRERGEAQAALAMGGSGWYVVTRHIVPRTLPLLVPQFVRLAKGAIMLEASLSFLGLGDPTAQSWGTMLYYAQVRSAFLTEAWAWWVLPPGLGIAAAVVSFAFIGYAVEERSRPVLGRAGATGGDTPSTSPEVAEGDGTSVLSVSDLTVVYETPEGPVRALDDVTIQVAPGEVVGVIGESGSGKTTLAHTVLGMLGAPGRIVKGGVRFDGHDMRTLTPAARREILGSDLALIPQSAMNALNPVVPVLDQIVEVITAHRGPDVAAHRLATAALELVGIPTDRVAAYPHEFSGGMRQRALIAMAMVNHPALIVADEITSGLDLVTQAALLRQLAALRADSGSAMLFITHDLSAAVGLADQLVVMQAGRIVESGPTDRMVTHPGHPYTQQLLAAVPNPRRKATRTPLHSDARPVCELRNVSRVFRGRRRDQPGVRAVRDVTLHIREREVVGLVGASGAGKSTIARLITGLERPDAGTIRLEDQDLLNLPRAQRRLARNRCHLVFQDPYESLAPHWRVARIVAEPLAIVGAPDDAERRRRVEAALTAVALNPPEQFLSRFPHELSGGERQRVALARAAVHEPALILADEPTSLLDASLRLEVVVAMQQLRDRRGTAFLYITHDLALAHSFCDRLLIMANGQIIEEGSVEEIIHRPRREETAALVHAALHDYRGRSLSFGPTPR